jgi:hypothetical protein
MKPYRGTLLASAALLALLPLFGCGDSDKWEKTTEITLSAPEAEGLNEVIFTVVSPPPLQGYACDTLLEYRAEGAGVHIIWDSVPGTETTRIFKVRPRGEGTMSVIARGKCADSKEDWKYSNRVDVTVKEIPPPTVTSVTLTAVTASPYVLATGGGVTFTLGASAPVGCTLVLSREHTGVLVDEPSPVTPTSVGTHTIHPRSVGALIISASGWCAENPAAVVVATPLNIAVILTAP